MDCEEIHDVQTCPVCGSETFAFISRWIPAPTERRRRPRPVEPEKTMTVNTYRELLSPTNPPPSGVARWLRRGAVGVAALTAVGWAWQRRSGTAPQLDNGDAPSDGDSRNT